jgi:peptide-methionine (R)-S-oxide reductase
MISRRGVFRVAPGAVLALASIGMFRSTAARAASPGPFEVVKTEAEWRRLLTPAQFAVLRDHGTEAPGSSPLNSEKRAGEFRCAGCELFVFSSTTKYDSGTGWPSFWAPVEGAIGTMQDRSLFMTRTEVHCRRCGGHLGHVFDDGPKPTGKRYCINGVALSFVPASATSSDAPGQEKRT